MSMKRVSKTSSNYSDVASKPKGTKVKCARCMLERDSYMAKFVRECDNSVVLREIHVNY